MKKKGILTMQKLGWGIVVLGMCMANIAFAQAPFSAGVVCNSKSPTTNIRSGPTAKGTSVVDKLANNAAVKILDRVKNPEGTHDWLKVEFKNSQNGALSTGYVYHEIISLNCGDAAPTTTAQTTPPTLSAPAAPPPAKLEPELEYTLRGHGDGVTSAAFSPDGALIVTASFDKTAKVWDAKTGNVLATSSGHENPVPSAAFSPDGARIVTASYDDTAKIWDAKTGSVLATLIGHGGSLSSAAFSPDGARIVTASSDKTVKVWDAKTGDVLATLSGHGAQVFSAAFSPDGARIVTASSDKTVKVWDAKTGDVLATLSGHGAQVFSATFSPDGARIVTASDEKTAKVWDAKNGNILATLSGHGDAVYSAAFSPDGAQIVTASWDKTAKVWDAKTGKVLATLSGHGNLVLSATFSPDGARIVTASWDKTTKVWLINPTPEERASLRERNIQAEAAFKKQLDDRKLAAAALECEKVKAIDDTIGADGQLEPCLFNKQLKTASARELYLAAAKFDAAKERDKAKKLYQAIVDRFPNEDLALQAATRITTIADLESIEAAKSASDKAAAEAKARAEAEAQARASAVQSRPPSIPGGRAAGSRVYLCAGKGDCCEAIIVIPGEGKSKVEFPRACFPGGLLNPVFYRERQEVWFDNNVFHDKPM